MLVVGLGFGIVRGLSSLWGDDGLFKAQVFVLGMSS